MKRSALVVVLLVGSAVGCAASGTLTAKGDAAFKAGNHAQAVADYRAAVVFGQTTQEAVASKLRDATHAFVEEHLSQVKTLAEGDLPAAVAMARDLEKFTAADAIFEPADQIQVAKVGATLLARWFHGRMVLANEALAANHPQRAYDIALAAGLQIRDAEREHEASAIETAAVDALLAAKLEQATQGGDPLVAAARLRGLHDAAIAAHRESFDTASIQPAAAHLVLPLIATHASLATAASTVRSAVALGRLWPELAAVQARVEALRAESGGEHRRLAEAAPKDQGGASALHLAIARAYGVDVGNSFTLGYARLQGAGRISYLMAPSAGPCAPAVASVATRQSDGGRPVAVDVAFATCTLTNRSWTENGTRTRRVPTQITTPTSKEVCRTSLPSYQRVCIGGTCSNLPNPTQKDCTTVYGTSTKQGSREESYTFTEDHRAFAFEATATVTIHDGAGETTVPISYTRTYNGEVSLAAPLSEVASKIQAVLSDARAANAKQQAAVWVARARSSMGHDVSQSEHAFMMATALLGEQPAELGTTIGARYGLSAADLDTIISAGALPVSPLAAVPAAPSNAASVEGELPETKQAIALPAPELDARDIKVDTAPSPPEPYASAEAAPASTIAVELRTFEVVPRDTRVSSAPGGVVSLQWYAGDSDDIGFGAHVGVALGSTANGGFTGDGKVGLGAAGRLGVLTWYLLGHLGVDGYGGGGDPNYSIPPAFYAGAEARGRLALFERYAFEASGTVVARSTDAAAGPMLGGPVINKEVRAEARLLRYRDEETAWMLGFQFLSFPDARSLGASLGYVF